jgi:hypothetical protein
MGQMLLITHANDLESLYELVKRDFWVVSPCHSRAAPGRVMEGTRLTVVVRWCQVTVAQAG